MNAFSCIWQASIKVAYPFVKSIFDEIYELGKNQMKAKDPSQIGSWKKAVTTSDGCWLIRGHYSQCCTFVNVAPCTMAIPVCEVQTMYVTVSYGRAQL